jgi:hypothetical protein
MPFVTIVVNNIRSEFIFLNYNCCQADNNYSVYVLNFVVIPDVFRSLIWGGLILIVKFEFIL